MQKKTSKKNDKDNKIVPFYPLPYRDGNKVDNIYEEIFYNSIGQKSILTKCDYKDKKGKLVKDFTLHIKNIPEPKIATESFKLMLKTHSLKSDNLIEEIFSAQHDGIYHHGFFLLNGKTFYRYISNCYTPFGEPLFEYTYFEIKKELDLKKHFPDANYHLFFYDTVISSLIKNDFFSDIFIVREKLYFHLGYQYYDFFEGNNARSIFNIHKHSKDGVLLPYIEY